MTKDTVLHDEYEQRVRNTILLTCVELLLLLHMPHTKITLPNFFTIGNNKITELPDIMEFYRLKRDRVLLLGDRTTFVCGGDRIARHFKQQRKKTIKRIVTNSDEKNVERIVKVITQTKPDIVVGIGGGKVLDVAKLAAGKKRKKFISIPTTLSNDGIASPVAVIKNKQRIPISHITRAPFGVIVDLQIVRKAPIRHIRAGVGDLISNFSAVFDARLAYKKRGEKVNETALALAESGALGLLHTKQKHVKNKHFLTRLAQGLIKSGCAMCIIGSSRPASGSEHKISHSLDHLFSPRKTLHGEQVGIAALFTMALQKNEYLARVINLYHKIRFPHTVRYLSITTKQFIEVVRRAHAFRPHRYTILEDKEMTPDAIRHTMRTVGLI